MTLKLVKSGFEVSEVVEVTQEPEFKLELRSWQVNLVNLSLSNMLCTVKMVTETDRIERSKQQYKQSDR